MRPILISLLLLANLPALANSALADDKAAIVGTWKLVSVVYEDVETKERTPVLGEHPKGIQIATPEGRWLALVTAEGRTVPKTDEERARALQSMIAYTGRLPGRGRQGDHQGRGRLERGLGGRRTGPLHPVRGRPPVHRKPADPNVNNKTVRVIVIWEREKS